MNCLECKGACCEYITLPLFAKNADANRWLCLHGTKTGQAVDLEIRCSQLTTEGLCGIYHTRPQVCRDFKPGSAECIKAVKARRTKKEFLKIREKGDPECL